MPAFIDANLLIYLNTTRSPENQQLYRELYENILTKHRCYTNTLVLDETLYISKKKYEFPYRNTVEMINTQVLPFTEILSISTREYHEMTKIIQETIIRPSDALHLATMNLNNIKTIVSEDSGFDKIQDIERVWI